MSTDQSPSGPERADPAPSDAFGRLPLPDMNPRGLFRHFGPGLILMMTGDRHQPPGHRAGGRRPVRVRAALVHSGGVHLQVLRLRDGLPVHQRHRPEHARRLHDGARQVAGLVCADHHDRPVRPGTGGPARGGRRSAVLRLLGVSRPRSAGRGCTGWGSGHWRSASSSTGATPRSSWPPRCWPGCSSSPPSGSTCSSRRRCRRWAGSSSSRRRSGRGSSSQPSSGCCRPASTCRSRRRSGARRNGSGWGAFASSSSGTGWRSRFDPFGSARQARIWRWTSRSCRRTRRSTAGAGSSIGLWDFSLGHGVSFVLAVIFLLLAAVWLYPSPVEGTAVIGEIARIFTDSLGPGMMFVIFLLGRLRGHLLDRVQLLRRVAAGGGGVLSQPVPDHGGPARHRRRRVDRRAPQDRDVRVQRLPAHDALLAGRVRAHPRRVAAPGVPGAGGVGARVLHRAGHLLPEPVLLRNGDPEDRHGVLSLAGWFAASRGSAWSCSPV